MKKFTFELEPVLTHARNREELEELALANLLAARRDLMERREALRHQQASVQSELKGRREIYPDEIENYRRYLLSLGEQLAALERQEKDLAQQIRAQRTRLVTASQKRRVLEKLRERKQRHHRDEMERFLDQEAHQLFIDRLPRKR